MSIANIELGELNPESVAIGQLRELLPTMPLRRALLRQERDLAGGEELRRRLEAFRRYVSDRAMRNDLAAEARRTEVLIGELLGPAPGSGSNESVTGALLARHRRMEFRLMAQFADLVETLLTGDPRTVDRRGILKAIERAMSPVRLPSKDCDLRLGDFREVLADLPEGSVDVILTDPPYPAEFLPLWSDLAIFAKRVLTADGLLVAMSGQTHLPQVMQALVEHLPYRWTMAYLIAGSANVVHARRVNTMWKPVLVYGSSSRRLYDVVKSDASDKAHHDWGQSESGFAELLRLVGDPGQMICDPFAGGGTTALVALAAGCSFVGAEIDETVHARALARVA